MTTTLKTIEQRVRDILSKQFGVGAEQIQMDDNFSTYNGDSLDVVELTMAVEDEFGFEVPDEEMHKFTTGRIIVDYVTANVK